MTDDRRCLIVDPEPVVRMGVKRILADRFEVDEATCWEDARDVLTAVGHVDVAIVDLDARPDSDKTFGVALIRALRKARPGLGIVALARRAERHSATEAIDAGASAFVGKSSPAAALRSAVEAAAASDSYVDPATSEDGASSRALTRRQREILQLLANGHSTAAAANRLGLSSETIKTHTKAVLSRLEARDRAHAVAIGLRSGLID